MYILCGHANYVQTGNKGRHDEEMLTGAGAGAALYKCSKQRNVHGHVSGWANQLALASTCRRLARQPRRHKAVIGAMPPRHSVALHRVSVHDDIWCESRLCEERTFSWHRWRLHGNTIVAGSYCSKHMKGSDLAAVDPNVCKKVTMSPTSGIAQI